MNIFLPISLSICFGCSKEPSHWDSSFEYPQHMFWLRNKKISFWIAHFILGACWFHCESLNSSHSSSDIYLFLFVWFDSLRPINNLSVKQGWVFLGWTSTKLRLMCLAQGPQRSITGEARTRSPLVSSQALYHWATALPIVIFSHWYGFIMWMLTLFPPVMTFVVCLLSACTLWKPILQTLWT